VSNLSAHALSTAGEPPTPEPTATPETKPTPMSVKVLRNVDVPVLALALVLFLVAGLPIAGWIAGAGAWAIQRGVDELAKSRAKKAGDVRTRVGLLAGSMILRGWIVAGIIVAVGIGDKDAGLAAAILFIAVFTLVFTMTMAMRPFEIVDEKAASKKKPGAGR
jgi:hypothetical protein